MPILFDFSPSYQPAPGIKRFLSGTPNILSLTALDGALDVFTNVCMRAVRSKSLAMSELFIGLKNTSASLGELKLVTPAEPALRGSQLAWSHDSAFEITQALIEQGVIVDFREPNILRFGFAPLYQSYADVWHAVTILQQIMSSQLYKEPRFSIRERVT